MRKTLRRSVSVALRDAATATRRRNREANMRKATLLADKASRLDKHRAEKRALVEGMTNWQRTKWSQAGFPGLRNADMDGLRHHATLQRPAR